jgi:hypothetical protein
MLHKTIIVGALVGVISCLGRPAIAQETRRVHEGGWPISNGVKHQPTRGGAGDEFTPGQAQETDKLYNELLNGYSDTHHTGDARTR